MRLTTKLARAAVVLVCFAAGVLACQLWAVRSPDREMQKLAGAVAHGNYALAQYLHGDYDTAQAALLTHIHLLDELSAEPGRPARTCYAEDAMTSYVRLARLAARNGRAGAGEYLKEAETRCRRLGEYNCFETYLRSEVKRLDDIGPYRGELSR